MISEVRARSGRSLGPPTYLRDDHERGVEDTSATETRNSAASNESIHVGRNAANETSELESADGEH